MHKDLYNLRLIVLGMAMVVAFGALAAHLYTVQIGRHDEFYEKAKEKYTATFTRTGNRGKIFDTQGTLLAGVLACRDVYAEPRLFDNRTGKEKKRDPSTRYAERRSTFVARYVARRLDLPVTAVMEKFTLSFRPEKPQVEVVLARGLEIKKASQLEEDLRAHGIRGIRFADVTRRYYPKDTLLANLIGFVDNDGIGRSGVEKLLDDQLKPSSGRTSFERDRRGTPIPDTETSESQPRDGCNIYLTVDETIQHFVEDELRALVEKHQPRAAFAVMADPKTGAILAMAQIPTFNPNERGRMDPQAWQNRMLVEGYEPGSIMKGVSVCGALDYGVVTLDTKVDCESGLWLYRNRTLRDSGHKYGILSVREIIQKSSNIGTAKIALMMGEPRTYDVLDRFGFGKPTGLGFGEEAPGIFRPLKKWDGLSVTRMPIGQGILVTPLQMVQAYCALANKGVMPQLHVIDKIEDPETGKVERFRPSVKSRVAGEKAVHDIVEALKLVTQEGGTATKAAVPGFAVGGKTGTAQKAIGGSYTSRYVSSFIGFVPADDPAIVLLVTADEPSRGGYYGGTVAGPTFSRIAAKTLSYKQISPETAAVPEAAPAGVPAMPPDFEEGDFSPDEAPAVP